MRNLPQSKSLLIIFLLTFSSVMMSCGGNVADVHNPPVIIVESPASLFGMSGLVRITGIVQAKTGFSVSTPVYNVDDQLIQSATGQSNWFFDLDTTHFVPGLHVLQISVSDSGGKSSTLDVEFSVSPVPGGNLKILSGLDSATLEDSYEITNLLFGIQGWRITYLSSDEMNNPVSVGGWAMKPEGVGPFPILIWCKGNISSNANESQIWSLAKHGFAVFASDYQGEGTLSTGTPDIFGTEVYDTLALLSIAKTMPYVYKDRVYIWGASRGSSVALLTLDRLGIAGRSNEITAAACTSTIYDIETAMSDGINPAENEVIEYFKSLKGVSTQAAIDQLLLRSAGFSINHDDITTPIFIGHAEQNEDFPPFHSEALFNDMTDQDVVVEYHLYPNVVSNLETDPEADVFTDIIDFWLSQ